GLPELYVQRIGSEKATPLAGTEGASYPFWSPDSASLAFFANGKLQRISASGGATQKIADVLSARGGSWGNNNVIIYAPSPGSPIWRVNLDGSSAAAITEVTQDIQHDETDRWPVFLPDGKHFLYWRGNFGNAKDDRYSGIYCGSVDSKEKKLVVLCRSNAGISGNRLFYADDDRRLVSMAFDPSSGTVSGTPQSIAAVV